MIHTYQIEGLTLQTGDVICTMNGKPDILPGQFWWLVGKLVPGDVDHVAIYLGPDGRCVEAGARGAEKVGEVVSIHVIPRPHPNVDQTLPLGRQEASE